MLMREIVKEKIAWGNTHRQDLLLGVGVITLLLVSFGLGRLSVVQNTPPEAIFIEGLSNAPVHTSDKEVAQYGIVASQKGSKYHLLSCPGAKQIKEENKIYFANEEDARKAGYEAAGNCPGLAK